MVESKLDFTFADRAIKFDDTRFYEVFKSYLPNGYLQIFQKIHITSVPTTWELGWPVH